jgi:hypothetical protein
MGLATPPLASQPDSPSTPNSMVAFRTFQVRRDLSRSFELYGVLREQLELCLVMRSRCLRLSERTERVLGLVRTHLEEIEGRVRAAGSERAFVYEGKVGGDQVDKVQARVPFLGSWSAQR